MDPGASVSFSFWEHKHLKWLLNICRRLISFVTTVVGVWDWVLHMQEVDADTDVNAKQHTWKASCAWQCRHRQNAHDVMHGRWQPTWNCQKLDRIQPALGCCYYSFYAHQIISCLKFVPPNLCSSVSMPSDLGCWWFRCEPCCACRSWNDGEHHSRANWKHDPGVCKTIWAPIKQLMWATIK